MPQEVTREQLQAMLSDGAQLIDVLPRDEYDHQHLPGAVSIPLKALTVESVAGLRRDQPVVVYCFDFL